ncbi:Dynein heavy chain 10, axonemal [Perkinsus olseni]|uniref:Dynein heavy chain 10, axonemal n=1 Tax=Perkinsus olseni TaxID=32597 RepID=A0A7J6LIF7_PEROL|nr:Dynein heavy chain 10, axonemal [Perkinsus olseni]
MASSEGPGVGSDSRALWVLSRMKELIHITDVQWRDMLSQDGSESCVLGWLDGRGGKGQPLVFYVILDKAGEKALHVSTGMHELSRVVIEMGRPSAGMYFIKTASGKIETAGKEVNVAMLNSCIFGVLGGSTMLYDVQRVMEQLFLPALEYKPPRSLSPSRNRASLTASHISSGPQRLSLPEAAAMDMTSIVSSAEDDEDDDSDASEQSVDSDENENEGDDSTSNRLVQLGGEVKDDLMLSASKFNQRVGQVASQVYGLSSIRPPEGLDLDELLKMIEEGSEAYEGNLRVCVETVEKWTEEVEKLLEAENAQSSATGKHPMAEILFWRDRSERLSSLFEQLKLGACQKVVEVVERYLQSGPGGEGTESGGRVLGRFKERQSALHKLHLEAKDNVRFLMTLERHLKKLTNGGMTEIAETLPNLLNALRMVWVVSRYYNTDERMEPLLTRIAEQIAGRVNDQISVRALLRRSPVRAGAIVGRCKATLDGWERSYMETRSRIEESGSDHRWEFDRAKLFKRTKYMSKICGDLMEITKVLEQFYKFLGPELKEVTGDPVGIDNLLEEVASSAAAFKTFSECFDERHRKAWDRVMQQFREKTVEIEDKAIVFLDTRFRQLRSAEGAFQLLQNFKSIQSRERINEKMNEKFADIVVQVSSIIDAFSHRSWPSPFGRVQLFSVFRGPSPSREGRSAGVGRDRLGPKYSGAKRHEGRASSTYVVNLAPELIELMKEAQNFDLIGGFELPGAVLNLALQMDKYKDYAEQLRVMLRGYEEAIGGLTMVQCKVLHTQIADLHKCLRPGLTPLNWNSLGIVDFIESATRGIAAFRNIREQVEKSEERVQAVVESIEQSILVRPFDWTKTDLSPSPSTSTLAEDSVDSSSDYQRVMDVQEFYDYFETHRLSEVEKLVDQYEAIGPFLIKIEETTAGTKSGAAESMREYYAYWERKFFNAITTALVRGLSTFQVLLTSTAAEGNQRPPLIKIRSEFNPPEVVVGSLHGVFKLITKLLQNVLHSSAAFVRWMDGTCLLVPTQSTELDEEKALAFSFYKDVSQNPALIEMTMTIQNSVQQVFQTINKFMRSWKKYDTQWGLWDVKRRQDLERVAVEKKHGLGYFDAHLKVYKNLVETMLEQKRDHDVAFIRVDCSAIITGIRSQAQEWTREYGRILADMASKDLDKIRVEIRDHKDNIDFTPTKLEELKSMLNTISTIEAVHMDMEIRIADVREKYRTLLSYKCKVKAEELSLADRLPDSWRSLKRYSRAKDLALEKSKIEFADITKQEVVDFSAECSKLLDDFSAGGPGTDDVNLEEGAELMRKYQNEMNQRLKRKEELVRSETLFNLPITSYVELVILEKQLKLLTNVYDIYEDHRRMVEEFSNMLWTKIDIGLLERTSDEYDKKVRKKGKELPELKTSVVFKKLEQVVSDFKQSVPLIASLKTEAIKASHWGELMALAGQAGDEDAPIDLSSMTLKSVFALELQRFPDEVNEIRTAATNEMNIENELKRIEAAWRALDLDMGIYKGDRGHVLRGNEELRQTLEDHVLVLQSMSMSKYAVKLMDFIKRWEKNLNVVNEVLSAWLTVQRKWIVYTLWIGKVNHELVQIERYSGHPCDAGAWYLVDHQSVGEKGASRLWLSLNPSVDRLMRSIAYLESIFLDSDDIRLQLPEEAKKFDKIHKVFKELMERTLSELKGLTADLDRTQKSLTDYLDTKRALFPRFYFISDDELLSILGSSDPQAVQPHSLKLFDNAKEIVFKPGTSTVIGMVSDEGERWSFGTPVKAVGAVEEWMTKVDDEMKDSLLRLMKEAVYQYPSTPRTKWILSRLGMVVLAGTQIWWTWSIEDTFKRVMEKGDKNAMKRELRKESHELGQLVELIRTDLSSCNRKCVNTLIILDVHARDIVDRFVRDSILDAREFAWESQLRFMWDRRLDDILIKQCTGSFRYCYEYQGLNGRLVITPLTDRCVMTLTTALTFLLGGSPAGPAGTGKTETVKDLAKSLAIRCVVFNCGEGLDFKAMGFGQVDFATCGKVEGYFGRLKCVLAESIQVINVPLFQGLLSDLFPGLECPRVGYPSLKKAIEEELGSRSMKHRFEDLYLLQVDKVMQLYETMLTRHTTMVVGKTMAGKSAVIECLAGAQKRAFDTPTHLFPINPKMVTVNELYGVLDPATRDWTDGLLSKIFRDINQPVPAGRGAEKRYILFVKWVRPCLALLCDGRVDGEVLSDGPLAGSLPRSQVGTDYVVQLSRIFDSMIVSEEAGQKKPQTIAAVFIFTMVWSLGSVLEERTRDQFDNFMKNLVKEKKLSEIGEVKLPKESLYEMLFDSAREKWVPWKERVAVYEEGSPDRDFNSILVPTVDTTRYSWLRSQFARVKAPCLFVGESGTAKSVTIINSLETEPVETSQMLLINFSSRTSSADFQRNIEDNIFKRTGRLFGPEQGKTLRIFVDDLSMPKIDKYGTQQPLALLKFVVEKGFMYERSGDLEKIIIQDVEHIAAMQPPGAGRNSIDPRVVSLYCAIGITFPSTETIDKIYSSILKGMFVLFGDEVRHMALRLPNVTLSLHRDVVENLPRSPSKFHYIFNLRDLSRVYQGVCQADPQVITTAAKLVRLWRHEFRRVYADRLINDSERDYVDDQLMGEIIEKHFPECREEALREPLVFGDFKDVVSILEADEPTGEVRLYEDMTDWKAVNGILAAVLELYNMNNSAMNLVLFVDALRHMTRIHRILRLPQGNALLVGIGGLGKQSLTKLAAFAAEQALYEITLCRGYGDSNLKEDLKALYQAAVKGPQTFLFTDANVVEEGFLEYINNMLTVGMVPALFADDEKESLISGVRGKAKAEGVSESRMWSYCVNHIRSQLHLVLAMSPAGSALRVRCRNFPGLVTCTTIDWFQPWPTDALLAVATQLLAECDVPADNRQDINQFICEAHLSVTTKYSPDFEAKFKRRNFATPKNYLDFLSGYEDLLAKNRKTIDAQTQRLGGGLDKLIQAANQVTVMSKDLAEKKVVVDEKALAVGTLIEEINEKSITVSKHQKVANEQAKQIADDNVIIQREKEDADTALAEALPALDMAAKALEELDKKDITEVKSMASPPAPVMIVCQCVLILKPLGKEDENGGWAAAKQMLSDVGLLRALQVYKKDDMKDRQIKKIKELLAKDKDVFEGDNMKNISKAGFGLLQWVKAMIKYHEVARTVEPKRKLVAELTQKKEEAEANLERINEELRTLAENIQKLSEEEVKQSAVLKALEEEADTMQRKLEAASKLIDGLGSERARWSEDITLQGEKKKRLVGDCLLGSAFISYAGPFNHQFRNEMLYGDWHHRVVEADIPTSGDFKLEALLTSDVEVALWSSQGLPSDELSVQNGILTTRTNRFPLCVDPQMQAVTWLKKKEEKSNGGLTVKTFNDEYIKYLELAIQYGKPFLFENLDEEIDPMIDPVLEKRYVMQNGQKMLTLGDNTIEWSDTFVLFMTTRISNPRYSPEVMGKVSIINYTVTLDGLAAQLLNVVVGFERPDLQAERQQLVQSMSENRQIQKNLEDTLLRELAASKGSILDNEDLIQTLQTAKTKALEITEALETAARTSVEIDNTREIYSEVAKRGSILYFATQGLSAISEMYEYSLGSYLAVFEQALREAKPDKIIDNRLKNVREKLTQNVYDFTCMGLFERHKLLYSFQMTCMIMEGEDELVREDHEFFLKGNPSLEKVAIPNPHPDWLPDTGWKDMQVLPGLGECFENIISDVSSAEGGLLWREWFDLEQPESSPMPMGYDQTCDPFQQLLVIRCLRTDRVVNAIKNFIMWRLGEYYVQPPSLVYDKIFQQSNEKSPIVFILSPGADPQSDVQQLGEKLGFTAPSRFRFLALGQGMGPVAQSSIEAGYQRGHWVMLQNCHLLTRWLRTLETILEGMHKPHSDFRLWLTTQPTQAFPLGILQRSLKVVTEPPDGLKLNMKQSYAKITDADLDECERFFSEFYLGTHDAFKPLIFVLAFFHAVVQDRRKYGSIGWNVPYDFNESDFKISFQLLRLYIDKAQESNDPLPWETMRYLIGEAMYGGRVTDNYDRRVLCTYLEEYMGDFVFDENQDFYFSRSGHDYTVPKGSLDVEAYVTTITALPITQSPAVFGLHPNAEITYFSNSAKDLWLGVLSMQAGDTSGGGGMSREAFIQQTCQDIIAAIPKKDLKFVKDEGPLSPTEVVLSQEVDRFNALATSMYDTLVDLGRALVGEIGMSNELDELGTSIFNGFLPNHWARLAPRSEKPLGSWMDHFRRRLEQYSKWIAEGDPNVMWLAGLHVPESLLSALVQAACRKRGWPLDKSTLYTQVTKMMTAEDVVEPLEFGTYVEGLYLEGARWDVDRGELARQHPKQLVVLMPLIQIIPVEAARLKLRESLPTPVYLTPKRRDAMGNGLVFEANLRTREHPSVWILQGVALFLNTDQFFSGVIADGTKELAKIALFGHDHTGVSQQDLDLGMLRRIAAWGAMGHRHTINAAVSSSTPVKSVIENKDYNDLVAAAFENEKIGGSKECLEAVTRAHDVVGKRIRSRTGRAELEEVFGLRKNHLKDFEDWWMWSSKGLLGFNMEENDPGCTSPYCNVAKICSKMTAVGARIKTQSRKSQGPHWLTALATIRKARLSNDGTRELTRREIIQKDPTNNDPEKLHWFLKCHQYPTFETCDFGSNCPWVRFDKSSEFFFSMCRDAFGITEEEEEVRETSTSVNRNYGGKGMNDAKGIISVNVEVDPWSSLTVAKSRPRSPVITIPGASHATWSSPKNKRQYSDFKEYYAEVYVALSDFMSF